ncbi:RecQ family ATP-dependent DNA helicase [Deinococcus hohokamensis]|uniref:ATP-dependent DNA helicase RecQ n=1 Tax=Deinococcus hohokamensis TaxID=309883 RepID=A0ABV9IBZ4_9DEIO
MPTRRIRRSRTTLPKRAQPAWPEQGAAAEPAASRRAVPPRRIRVTLPEAGDPEPLGADAPSAQAAPEAPAPPQRRRRAARTRSAQDAVKRRSKSRPALDPAAAAPPIQQAQRIAREVFGYDRLHEAQREAIASVLGGRDTLAILPTGSGKSAIYQVAALSLTGQAVVVSPLIALQRDQVDTLNEHVPGQAALLNSTLRPAEREEALAAFGRGTVRFLFLAPEQLANEDTLERLTKVGVTLFVVDEAHCVSEWGHDFRPDYLGLGRAVQALGSPTVLALTATAAPPTRAEIVERLNMRRPRVLVRSFDRPNIHLTVRSFADARTKGSAALDHVAQAPGPGIVYVSTRRSAEAFADDLQARGLRAAAYHAGLPAARRDEVQTAFMADELQVLVATTAFGMGIDKPNIRFVVHLDISGSLDAYSQEIGRAGRDGEPAQAVLFYAPGDLHLRRFFASGPQTDAGQLEEVIRAVQANGGEADPDLLAEELGMRPGWLRTALHLLTEAGALQRRADGSLVAAGAPEPMQAAALAAEGQRHRQAFEQSRLDMMRGYAETGACRREFLLNYFGEDHPVPCQGCDNCQAGQVSAASPVTDRPFDVGCRVTHQTLGEGTVVRCDDQAVTVLFDEEGYQMLALSVVLEGRLLDHLPQVV